MLNGRDADVGWASKFQPVDLAKLHRVGAEGGLDVFFDGKGEVDEAGHAPQCSRRMTKKVIRMTAHAERMISPFITRAAPQTLI